MDANKKNASGGLLTDLHSNRTPETRRHLKNELKKATATNKMLRGLVQKLYPLYSGERITVNEN